MTITIGDDEIDSAPPAPRPPVEASVRSIVPKRRRVVVESDSDSEGQPISPKRSSHILEKGQSPERAPSKPTRSKESLSSTRNKANSTSSIRHPPATKKPPTLGKSSASAESESTTSKKVGQLEQTQGSRSLPVKKFKLVPLVYIDFTCQINTFF